MVIYLNGEKQEVVVYSISIWQKKLKKNSQKILFNRNYIAFYTVVKSKLANWGAASWSTGVTDHVTRSD